MLHLLIWSEAPRCAYLIALRDKSGMVHDEEGAEFYNLEAGLDEARASARDLGEIVFG